jgi:hypothetical protein
MRHRLFIIHVHRARVLDEFRGTTVDLPVAIHVSHLERHTNLCCEEVRNYLVCLMCDDLWSVRACEKF